MLIYFLSFRIPSYEFTMSMYRGKCCINAILVSWNYNLICYYGNEPKNSPRMKETKRLNHVQEIQILEEKVNMCIQDPTFNLSRYWSPTGPQQLHEKIFTSLLPIFDLQKPEWPDGNSITLVIIMKELDRSKCYTFFPQQFYDNYLQDKYTTIMNELNVYV